MQKNKDYKEFYDRAYKKLFSNKGFVRNLLQSFVKLKWVESVDFEKITLEPVSFIDRNFSKKEADLIWKLPLKNGKTAYLYLLLEFQSTVDKRMPLRLLSYILNFYEQKYKKKKDEKLPVVFPLVLYNGKSPWNAAKRIEEMIDIADSSLREYVIRQKHYVIDIGRFSAKSLRKLHRNLLGAMFMMEKARIGKDLEEAFREIVEIFHRETDREMSQLFSDWLETLFKRESVEVKKITAELKKNGGEPMILELLDELREKHEKMGEKRGRKLGERKAKLETAREMLKEGLSIDFIKKVTKLSEKEINDLVDQSK